MENRFLPRASFTSQLAAMHAVAAPLSFWLEQMQAVSVISQDELPIAAIKHPRWFNASVYRPTRDEARSRLHVLGSLAERHWPLGVRAGWLHRRQRHGRRTEDTGRERRMCS